MIRSMGLVAVAEHLVRLMADLASALWRCQRTPASHCRGTCGCPYPNAPQEDLRLPEPRQPVRNRGRRRAWSSLGLSRESVTEPLSGQSLLPWRPGKPASAAKAHQLNKSIVDGDQQWPDRRQVTVTVVAPTLRDRTKGGAGLRYPRPLISRQRRRAAAESGPSPGNAGRCGLTASH
jgi:hypothetical protein